MDLQIKREQIQIKYLILLLLILISKLNLLLTLHTLIIQELLYRFNNNYLNNHKILLMTILHKDNQINHPSKFKFKEHSKVIIVIIFNISES